MVLMLLLDLQCLAFSRSPAECLPLTLWGPQGRIRQVLLLHLRVFRPFLSFRVLLITPINPWFGRL